MSRGGHNKLTHEAFVAKVYDKFGDKIKVFSTYKGADSPVTCFCTECQKKFSKKTAIQLFTSAHGCQYCAERISKSNNHHVYCTNLQTFPFFSPSSGVSIP